jgi:hypothetical protein
VVKKKKTITTSIYTYDTHSLLDRFNIFVSNVISAPVEAENKELDPPKNPERLLFLAVIYQALLDATKAKTNRDSDEIKRNRHDATKWFTIEYGTTATDFEEVCLLAGIEPSATRSFAKKLFNNEIKFERKRINVLINPNEE